MVFIGLNLEQTYFSQLQ